MHSFYELFGMIKERKVREGDILVIHENKDKEFRDYYMVTKKDIVWLVDNSSYIFDNYFLFELFERFSFEVVFRDKEKQAIMKKIRKDDFCA